MKTYLEEAAERYSINNTTEPVSFDENAYCDFIEGAKWQKEQDKNKYSEEDMTQLLNFVTKEYNISNGIGWFHDNESIEDISSKEVLKEWFEKNKIK